MMFTTQKTSHNLQKQQGAALVVSLIILVVMTIIGVTSMGTSIMQEKMASNAQNSNITFQAAESAVGGAINNVLDGSQSELNTAMNAPDSTGPITAYDVEDPNVTASYQIVYQGVVTLTSSGSLDADEGSTTLQAQRFEMSATASVESLNAQSIIRRGIEYQ